MNWYDLLLFAHISGALGFFSGVALWAAVLMALRRAQRVEDVRTLSAIIHRSLPITIISILVLLAAGVSMVIMSWSFTAGWIEVALGSLALIAPMSPTFIDSRLKTIAKLADNAPDGPLSHDLASKIHNPLLASAMYSLVFLVLGIVALMVLKPPFDEALVIMGSALVLGVIVCVPLWRHTNVAKNVAL